MRVELILASALVFSVQGKNCPTVERTIGVGMHVLQVAVEKQLTCPDLDKLLKEIGSACGGVPDLACLFKQVEHHSTDLENAVTLCFDHVCHLEDLADLKQLVQDFDSCDETLEGYANDLIESSCSISPSACKDVKSALALFCSLQPRVCKQQVGPLVSRMGISCKDQFSIEPDREELQLGDTLGKNLFKRHCPTGKEIGFAIAEVLGSGDLKQCQVFLESVANMSENCLKVNKSKGLGCFIAEIKANREKWMGELEQCHDDLCENPFLETLEKQLRSCDKSVRDYMEDVIKQVCRNADECTVFSDSLREACKLDPVKEACNLKVSDVVAAIPITCVAKPLRGLFNL